MKSQQRSFIFVVLTSALAIFVQLTRLSKIPYEVLSPSKDGLFFIGIYLLFTGLALFAFMVLISLLCQIRFEFDTSWIKRVKYSHTRILTSYESDDFVMNSFIKIRVLRC